MSYEKPWMPGPIGFEPKDLEPPRFEFKDLQEKVLFLDYDEQVNTLGVASKLTRTYGHRFWGEVFSLLMPITDFIFAFVLELYGYATRVGVHIFLGLVVRSSDYVIKPILVFTFNALLIPCMTQTSNVLRAVTKMVSPVIDLVERLVIIASIPIRALKIFHFTNNSSKNYGKEPFNA